MLGGFHFNDRRYADDDLTLGSIDPYQVFRIFHEIGMFEWECGKRADIAYMVDQSHNLKDKIEAMIQTVAPRRNCTRRRRWWIMRRLARPSRASSWWSARSCLKDAFRHRRAAGDPRMAGRRDCRKIRCRRSARADIWSALRASARRGDLSMSVPMPECNEMIT